MRQYHLIKDSFSKLFPTVMSSAEKVDMNVKILLIGDSNVGKSWYAPFLTLTIIAF